jgi:hypothetical protein
LDVELHMGEIYYDSEVEGDDEEWYYYWSGAQNPHYHVHMWFGICSKHVTLLNVWLVDAHRII